MAPQLSTWVWDFPPKWTGLEAAIGQTEEVLTRARVAKDTLEEIGGGKGFMLGR